MSEINTENAQVSGNQNDSGMSLSYDLLVFLWEVAKVVLISLAIIVPIRYYLVQPFFVKGPSMESNFHDKDYLIVDEISYSLGEPKRGEAVIFRYPANPKEFFIKRIIGLPGEEVLVRDNKITIFNRENPEGIILKEEYIDSNQVTSGNMRTRLDENEYWVMGDNRMNSHDSRAFGPVNKSYFIGRATLRLFPFDRIGVIKSPTY